MSAFTLLRNNPKPSKEEVEKALEGNLCRCTGYRPILEALSYFTKEQCPMGDNCCKNRADNGTRDSLNTENPSTERDASAQVPIFPPELQLPNEYHSKFVSLCGNDMTWYRPTSLAELVSLKDKYPDALIIMGNTTAALLLKHGDFSKVIYGGSVTELKTVETTDTGVSFGAAVTMSELKDHIRDLCQQLEESKRRHFQVVLSMVEHYGSDQIRNVATLSGSILSGRSNSDVITLLTALKATVTVSSVSGERTELLEDITIQNNEVIRLVTIQYAENDSTEVEIRGLSFTRFFANPSPIIWVPIEAAIITSTMLTLNIQLPYLLLRPRGYETFEAESEKFVKPLVGQSCMSENAVYEFYKQADRRTFSLGIINSGMFVRLDGNKVKDLRVCFGGVSRKVVLATKIRDVALGRIWDETILQKMISVLPEDLVQTQTDRKDKQYKLSVASAFIFKFYTVVKHWVLKQEDKDNVLKTVAMGPCTSSQFYYPCTDEDQPDDDPVGRPIPNVASQAIVSGEAIYVDDLPSLQGELFLALVLSTRLHAKIIRIDAADALTLGGVHSFIDHNDISGQNLFGLVRKDEEFFATREVIYFGQPIGAILAESREIANVAAKLVKVDYEDLDQILTIEDAIQAESYLDDPIKLDNGDIEKGFHESAHVIQGEYATGFQEHFYMEPQSILIVPKKENDEMEVFCATQDLTAVQESVSNLLNIPRSKITCRVKRVGGAFGGKDTRVYLIVGPAAVAAHKTRRPVRCILPREIDMLITGKRHPIVAKYKVGVDVTGHIKALDIHLFCNAGCTLDTSSCMMLSAAMAIDGCYNIPNTRIRGHVCKTNLPSNTSKRGVGRPQAALIIEDIVFRIASELKMPQEKVRETNLIKEGHITSWGQQLTNVTIGELWHACMESSDFDNRRKEIDSFNRSSRWKKRGLATTTTQFGIGTGILSCNQGAALVNIYLDGSVLVSHGGIEVGQGLNTKMIQVASRVLGVPLEKIHTVETSSVTVPNSIVTGASFATDLHAPAVVNACCTLNERLKPVKAKYPNATWEELIEKAFAERVQLTATGFNKLEAGDVDFDIEKKVGRSTRYVTYGAVCSEVEIDVLTGENQVLQSDIIFDVGKSLNPAIDIGQIEGAFVQGMGMVTSEFTDADENGRMINCSPLSYKIPNVRSIPRKLNVTLLKNYNIKTAIYSSKGVGEPPLLGSVSVIMAIKDAVQAARAEIGLHGYFRLDSPATVQRIQEACGEQLKK